MKNFEIGADIQRIADFKNSTGNFLKKAFSEKEIAYCSTKSQPEQHLAGIFAAKEAVIKALSQFNERIYYRDMELIVKDRKPHLNIQTFLKESYTVKISISHSGEYALGFAIIEKKE